MTTRALPVDDRDLLDPSRPTPVAERDHPTTDRHPPGARAGAVLGLQRQFGNAAVTGLLGRRSGPAPATRVAVQRDAGDPDWEHGLLPDLKRGGQVLGPQLRKAAAEIPERGRSYAPKRSEVDGIVEALRMHDAPGPDQRSAADLEIGAVDALRPGAKALGSKNKEVLIGAIDAYNTSTPELRGHLTKITAGNAHIKEASSDLSGAQRQLELKKTERAKDQAEKDLSAIEKQRADAIGKMNLFLDFAGILIDPAKGWMTALETATSMLGGSARDLLFAGTMQSQVAEAKAKVEQLSNQVTALEDATLLDNISRAAAKLEGAQLELSAELELLVSAVYRASVAREDLHHALRAMGTKGAAASGALDEGAFTLELGNEGALKVDGLSGHLAGTESRVRRWRELANQYRMALDDGAGAATMTMNQRGWARDMAIDHVRMASRWSAWVDGEKAHVQELDGFFAKGSFRVKPTKGIEAALKRVRSGARG